VKTVYVQELETGMELFDQPFLMAEVNQRKTRDGRPFILFTLADRTGRVGGVYWNVPDDVVRDCVPGKVVLVTGDVRLYNKRVQVVALDLQPFEPETMADFAQSTGRDRREMIAELEQVIGELGQPLQELLTSLLLAPSFLRRFADSPAARTMHHAYVGGLLEHSLALVAFCKLAADIYPIVDRDLLISGALLHDIGKVDSYEAAVTFPITDDERLVGHITMGALRVERAAQEIPGFPDDLLQDLLHLLVSNHGSPEWGSPIQPRTLEAVLLHFVDLLDSRAQGFVDHVTGEPGEAEWTSHSPMFGYELRRRMADLRD
jgi:3'-5' exoribonuclease